MITQLAAVVALAAGLTWAPSAAHGRTPLHTWSAPFGDDGTVGELATDHVTAAGRIWWLELRLRHDAVLRSRSLATGRRRDDVAVAIPRVEGALDIVGDDEDVEDGLVSPRLFVTGGRGFVTGTWCTEYDETDETDGCIESTSFYARFSLRTGRLEDSALSTRPRILVAGGRVSELVPHPGRSSVLRDAVTHRRIMTVPRTAYDIQGAGSLVSWKSGGDPDDDTDWTRLRVLRRATGRAVSTIASSAISRAARQRSLLVQETQLEPNGSISMYASVDGPFWPVFVDEHGRARRLAHRFTRANTFSSQVRGDRVALWAGSNANRPVRCNTVDTWLSDRSGRSGYELRGLPATRGYVLGGLPALVSPTTMIWAERQRSSGRRKPRQRAAHDYHALALTRAQAPRC